jgi:hypothetical protein
MSTRAEEFSRRALAEKEIAERAGPILTEIIEEIERRHGIAVGELRVTFDKHALHTPWAGANCVIVN